MNAPATITLLDTKPLAPTIDAAIKQASDIAASVGNIGALRIDNEHALLESAVVLQDLKNRKKSAETWRDSITKPLKALLDSTKKAFDGHIDTIKAVDDHVRHEVVAFRERQRIEAERVQRELQERAEAERAAREAEAAEARRLSEERSAKAAELDAGGSKLMAIAMQKSAERAAGDAAAADAAARQVTAVPVVAAHRKLDGVSVRRVLKFEIVDESQIPDAFWKRVLDETAIRKHGIDTDGAVPVPGIRYFHEESIAV